MKKLVLLAAAILMSTAPALVAAEKTWDGVISDARCAGKHSKDEHAATASGDHECSNKCIAGGQKAVFVSGGKTYEIANQDYAGIKDHSGHKIALTGEMKGDSITISKIEMKKAETENPKK
jgi:hypothetical protein